MTKSLKTTTAWAIYDGSGNLLPWTVASLRRDAIYKSTLGIVGKWREVWAALRGKGYRCTRVSIQPASGSVV